MRRERSGTPAVLAPLAAVACALCGYVAMQAAALVAIRYGHFGFRAAQVTAELALVTPSLLALHLWAGPVAPSLGASRVAPRALAGAALAGVSLWSAGLGVIDLQALRWTPPASHLELFRQIHAALRPQGPLDAALSVLAIAVAPALAEEVVFRGVVLPSFRRRFGDAAAVAVSALLFGFIHLDTLPDRSLSAYRVPFAVVVGTGLGLLRCRAESLAVPALAHGVLNTITFTAMLWVAPSTVPESPEPSAGLALLLAGSAGTALVLRWLRPPPPNASQSLG